MKSKDLARSTPVDFYIPEINKKIKNTSVNTNYPYIPLNNNRSLFFYSRFMPTNSSTKTLIDTKDDEFDSLLQRLTDLTVDETQKDKDAESALVYKPEILDLKKDILNILIEPQFKDTSFDDRFKDTEIPAPQEIVPPLTDQENAIVDRLFKKGQHGEISSLNKAIVSYQDIYRLYPETWLNDEIVNFYFELISDRASKSNNQLPSLYCYNTYFCSTLKDQGFAKVKRWTKRVDIFSKDVLFVPINQSYHWVLGTMDIKNKTVAVYDSLGGNHDHTLDLFLSYLEQEHLDKKKTAFDTSDWQKLTPKDIPRQGNMSDCGAFTCAFAERLSRRKPFNFGQHDMVTIRRRIALNIYNKAI